MHPDSDGPQGWIAREAASLASYCGYVHDFIGALRANLDRLDPDEATTAAALVDRSEARLDTARRAWAAIADRA